MIRSIPACETLAHRVEDGCLHLTFDRPQVRNALNARMVAEIDAVFSAIADDRSIRAVVLRGAGGTFCAGGDLKERAAAAPPGADAQDALLARSRTGGRMLLGIDRAPQVVIAVVEGAAMGGGFGMACVADVTIAARDARFGMPETTLGIPPAQIAPFVARRVGPSQARRLALTAAVVDGAEAATIGLVHHVCDDVAELEATLAAILARIDRCAPNALAATKRLIALAMTTDAERMVDIAAQALVEAFRSPEGQEGSAAFAQKRAPSWRRTA